MEKKGGKRCQLKSVVLIAGRVEIECKDVCKEVCKEGCKERVQRRGRGVGGIFFEGYVFWRLGRNLWRLHILLDTRCQSSLFKGRL